MNITMVTEDLESLISRRMVLDLIENGHGVGSFLVFGRLCVFWLMLCNKRSEIAIPLVTVDRVSSP